MNLSERNERLQDLRKRLSWLRTEQLAVEESIRQTNRQYRDEVLFQDKDLFTQMFEPVL